MYSVYTQCVLVIVEVHKCVVSTHPQTHTHTHTHTHTSLYLSLSLSPSLPPSLSPTERSPSHSSTFPRLSKRVSTTSPSTAQSLAVASVQPSLTKVLYYTYYTYTCIYIQYIDIIHCTMVHPRTARLQSGQQKTTQQQRMSVVRLARQQLPQQ